MLRNLSVALCICLLAQAGEARADSLVATIASWHASSHGGGDTVFNEVNPGLGYEYPLSESHTLGFGFYDNSYNRNTDYILDLWQPLQWTPDIGKIKFGLAMGLVSGYEGESFEPMAVPMLSYENHMWGLNLITLTFPTPKLFERSVFALQLKVNIP